VTNKSPGSTSDTVDAVYRAESRRVFATRIRLLGDSDLAVYALH
jgi:RNA polymerase sigma-70 factor (ECF subfamily)